MGRVRGQLGLPGSCHMNSLVPMGCLSVGKVHYCNKHGWTDCITEVCQWDVHIRIICSLPYTAYIHMYMFLCYQQTLGSVCALFNVGVCTYVRTVCAISLILQTLQY